MFFARYSDAILGALLTAGALLMYFVIVPIGVQVPKSNKILALSPDFWINIILWIMMALGGFLLYKGIQEARAGLSSEKLAAVESARTLHHPLRKSFIMATLAIANLFLYYFLIKWLGMVAASIISMVTFTLMCGERRWRIILPLSILLPVCLYFFFLKVASIPMPLGIFE